MTNELTSTLGCIFWELLAGRPLFAGSSPLDIMAQHLNRRIVTPSGTMDHSPGVASVIKTALEQNPADRWASASAMAEALDTLLASDVVSDPDFSVVLPVLSDERLRRSV